MKTLKKLLLYRYGITVAILLIITTLILYMFTPSILKDWPILMGSLVFILAAILIVSLRIQRVISSDLEEMGNALESLVLKKKLEAMPLPQLGELFDFAQNLETIAIRIRENYHMLEMEKERLETILASIETGILALDSDGKVNLINPAGERVLGVTRDYALGKTLTEIHPATAIDQAVEEAREGKGVSLEIDIFTPRKRTLSVRANPIIMEDGNIIGVICVLDDITPTRRLERIRRDFIVNVSHELRTPVSNIRALTEALQSGAIEEKERAQRFIADLDKESQRLANIIDDLLTLSRLESEEITLEEELVSASEIVSEAVVEKAALAEKYGVKLFLRNPEADITFYGNASMVKTAISNLLDNAIKYNREGGKVEVNIEELGGELLINISDTGTGIPKKDLNRIFERFYRVDKARSRDTGGTGLGLSIVKHVVEFHGGQISVKSREGEGSTFTISLPTPT